MHRMIILLLATAFGLAGASSASAASLSLSVSDTKTSEPIVVTASGTADVPGRVEVVGYQNGSSCPDTPAGNSFNGAANFRGQQAVPAGPFSFQSSGQPELSGPEKSSSFEFCGYVVRNDNVIDATAKTFAKRTAPPVIRCTSGTERTDPSERLSEVLSKGQQFYLQCADLNHKVVEIASVTGTIKVASVTQKLFGLQSRILASGSLKKTGDDIDSRKVDEWSLRFKAAAKAKLRTKGIAYMVTRADLTVTMVNGMSQTLKGQEPGATGVAADLPKFELRERYKGPGCTTIIRNNVGHSYKCKGKPLGG